MKRNVRLAAASLCAAVVLVLGASVATAHPVACVSNTPGSIGLGACNQAGDIEVNLCAGTEPQGGPADALPGITPANPVDWALAVTSGNAAATVHVNPLNLGAAWLDAEGGNLVSAGMTGHAHAGANAGGNSAHAGISDEFAPSCEY